MSRSDETVVIGH